MCCRDEKDNAFWSTCGGTCPNRNADQCTDPTRGFVPSVNTKPDNSDTKGFEFVAPVNADTDNDNEGDELISNVFDNDTEGFEFVAPVNADTDNNNKGDELIPNVSVGQYVVVEESANPVPYEYSEPSWWTVIETLFTGDDLKRCVKRQYAPQEGTACRKPPGTKTCFFGNQLCESGDTYPKTKCVCKGGTWSCTAEICPP